MFSLTSNFQADGSGDLDVVEVFKLEHYVAVVRREYVENYERRNPPAVTQNQMKKILSAHGNTWHPLKIQEQLNRFKDPELTGVASRSSVLQVSI